MTEPTKDLIPIQSKELVQEAREFCSSITEIVITTEDEYVNNCEVTKRVTAYSNGIEKSRKALLAPFEQKKKEINTYFKEAQNPLKNLRDKLRISLSNYTTEQERKKVEAQREADKEAEKERLRLEAQAKRDAEKSQKAAEEGDTKKAEEFHLRSTVRQDMAEKVVPVEIPKEVPKVQGISYRKTWSAKVADKEAFFAYCVQHKKYEYLDINMGLLNKFAKDFKDTIALPGIEFYSTKTQITG